MRARHRRAFILVELPAVSRRERGAFTLVELLVVIGIISVLIAILLPTVARARHQAQLTTCMARLHDLATSMVSYAAENRGYFPRQDIVMATGHNTHDVSTRFYTIFRNRFRRPHETFYCPTTPPEYASEKFAFTYTPDVNSDAGFVMIGYALWVPRLNGGVMCPPAPGSGFILYDPTEISRGPIKIGEKRAISNPIVTDLVLTTYIRWPPLVNDLSRDVSGLNWRWFSGHQQRGVLESANLAYGDGHVARVPGSSVQPRYCGGKVGVDSWNWR